MTSDQSKPAGPDLARGIAPSEIPDGGMIQGHVGDEAVLVARKREQYYAIGATCSHYGGPLAEGLMADDTVHCPWHHARFCLRTGEALGAPAFLPVSCWKVEQQGGKIFVREKAAPPPTRTTRAPKNERMVIVGGGAAGFASAEMLRREGFEGSVTLVSADDAVPYDRPNCSKDYLAGSAPEEWMPLRPEEYYKDQAIALELKSEVVALDARERQVSLKNGRRIPFDKLLLATGAEPIRLDIPGANDPRVHVLRSLSDSRTIIGAAKGAKRAVVIGASFIGLEAAAALRAREIEVHVVAPEARPLERILGREFGDFIRALHEEHGVVFHLGETPASLTGGEVKLSGGSTLKADLVVMGVGVRPRIALAEKAGLKIDKGVVANECLETSAPGVYAAGDIARWPDARFGGSLRIEHWVVAERQGQTAARNMLGAKEPFKEVPFFWSQHYDVPINYVGHAERWEGVQIDGDVKNRDCIVRYKARGKVLAAASIYRDVDSLEEEVALARG